jgi:hypothetical protein
VSRSRAASGATARNRTPCIRNCKSNRRRPRPGPAAAAAAAADADDTATTATDAAGAGMGCAVLEELPCAGGEAGEVSGAARVAA